MRGKYYKGLVMLEELGKIYHYLDDEESKYIFLNKIMYEISGRYQYINNIIDRYASKDERVCNPEYEKRLNDSISDKDRSVVIYGAGIVGKVFLSMIPKDRITCFCDINKDLHGTEIEGIPILSPEEVFKDKKNSYVIFAIWHNYIPEVRRNFENAGFSPEDLIDGTGFFMIRTICGDIYFDPQIIKYDSEEVFLDCGSYDLYTSEQLLGKCKNVKKIYAFEPDPANFQICIDKKDKINCEVELINAGLWDENKTLSFHSFSGTGSKIVENGNSQVRVVTIDSVLKGRKATFIKMDIEGAELSALKGGEETIKRYRPKLAISVYHKPNDIVDILLYIRSIVPEYKLYLRHHTNTEVDTVLYAVCNN